MSKETITRKDIYELWLSLYWTGVLLDGICRRCRAKIPEANDPKSRGEIRIFHLEKYHPELYALMEAKLIEEANNA